MHAMADAMVGMERRRDAYVARALSEGLFKQPAPTTAAEKAEAKAELDDIIRKVDASDDLPEVKPPVVRRRA